MNNQINYEIEFYKKRGAERSPVDDYLDTMPEKHRQKVMAIMARLEEEGPNLKRPHADILRGKIRELRCGFHTFEHRFLYFFRNKIIVITHGFLKKTRAVPKGEITSAEQAMREWTKRNKV
ncbi:MAG: type II toxin-antitoxin system RelE/ParE family toxin [Candidatus Omnitrophica bacterium]|nr:type II toxin-antitoxin system RelE/ParE family toxin [Candidatus Omnitrophota bacterium]MCG2711588.1 type II toxin-antitoxin system RelE/ParE family toxin [Candidatus Omnitrophota bacterium]